MSVNFVLFDTNGVAEVAADKEDGISFSFPQFVHQLPDRLPFIEMSRAWSTL